MKKVICILSMLISVLTMVGCAKTLSEEPIIILYTNDVHCHLDGELGYANLKAYKDAMEQETPYVYLVDAGDALQGELIGTVSKGECIVDIMNEVGYDYAVPGNHDFDYGMDVFHELVHKADAQYLCCNITYTGNGENPMEELEPFSIRQFGNIKVAFIGVTTPYAKLSEKSENFMEDGKSAYDFGENAFYLNVQNTVDQCLKNGADYVILIGHLGMSEAKGTRFTSQLLAKNTRGIDVIIDAHTHTVESSLSIKNNEGKKVLLTSGGMQFQNFGKVVIDTNGRISTSLISFYEEKDSETDAYINSILQSYEEEMKKAEETLDSLMNLAEENSFWKKFL